MTEAFIGSPKTFRAPSRFLLDREPDGEHLERGCLERGFRHPGVTQGRADGIPGPGYQEIWRTRGETAKFFPFRRHIGSPDSAGPPPGDPGEECQGWILLRLWNRNVQAA